MIGEGLGMSLWQMEAEANAYPCIILQLRTGNKSTQNGGSKLTQHLEGEQRGAVMVIDKAMRKTFDCHHGTSSWLGNLFRHQRFRMVRCQSQSGKLHTSCPRCNADDSLDLKKQQGSRKTWLTVRLVYIIGRFVLKVFWQFTAQPA